MCWGGVWLSLRRKGAPESFAPLFPLGNGGGAMDICLVSPLAWACAGGGAGGHGQVHHWREETTPGAGRCSPTSFPAGARQREDEVHPGGPGGQGTRPLGTRRCTHPIDENELGPAALEECTQDGQGGSGPQETQGRTTSYIIRGIAHGAQTECAQDGQGGSGPQETQGCTIANDLSRRSMVAPEECTQDGQGGYGPLETQGRAISYIGVWIAHGVQKECAQEGQGGSGPQET